MLKPLDEPIASLLDRRYRATATILFAQIFALVLLIVVSILIAGRFQPFGAATGDAGFSLDILTNPNGGATLTTFLWIAILALAVSSFLLRRAVLSPATLRDTAIVKGAAGLLGSLQTKTILLTAVGAVVAVLGFIIALASGDYSDMIRAAFVAAIIFFVNFPRKSAWQRLAVQAVSS